MAVATLTEKYPPPAPESRSERKVRFIALFVMAFLMVTMMYATYMATMHDPKLHDMPVAVVGQSQIADSFAEELRSETDGALEVRVVPDLGTVKDLMADREIAGAVAVPANGTEAQVYVASAAGASQSSLVTQTLTPLVLAQGWEADHVELAPLPDGDGTGTLVLFAAMGMMLAGYVPLSGMLNGVPNLLRVRRFLPLAVGWGALTSSLIWLILGPIVGAVDGNYPLFLGIGTLAVTAVALTQFLLTKLIGPLAVLLGMLLWVILGVPASNLGVTVHQMPGFFGWLHDVLPMPAAGEALRSGLYFEGRGIGQHLLTLGIWALVALVLVTLKERSSGHLVTGGPAYTEPDAPLAALAGGPIAGYRKRLFAAAAFPLAIMIVVVTLMSFGMHKAQLEGMPVAVIASEQVGTGFVQAVGPELGDVAELRVMTDRSAAEDLLKTQDLVAAYVLPTTPEGSPELLIASGAGKAQASAVTQVFSAVAAGSDSTLTVTDLVPLDSDDSNGTNAMYVAMAWIMSGFLLFAMFRGGAPDVTRSRKVLPIIAGWSVGMAVWLWFLFDVIIGAVNGHALALIGIGALAIFCVTWASAVLLRMFGLGALVPVMILIMLAGVPASGGGLSIYMVPEVFRDLASWLPLPAATDAVRSVLYFDSVGLGRDLAVLLAWGVGGILLNVFVVDRWVNRKRAKQHAPMGPRHAPERAPKKVKTVDTDQDGTATKDLIDA